MLTVPDGENVIKAMRITCSKGLILLYGIFLLCKQLDDCVFKGNRPNILMTLRLNNYIMKEEEELSPGKVGEESKE